MNIPIIAIPTALLWAGLLAGCETVSTDPREGGLLGGISGLSSGAYDARIQDRESRLDQMRALQRDLDAEQGQLETQKASRSRQLAADRTRLRKMDADLNALNKKVNRVAVTPQNEQKIRQVQTRIPTLKRQSNQLQSSLDALEGSGVGDSESDLRRRQLEAQQKALRSELDLLTQMSLDLSR